MKQLFERFVPSHVNHPFKLVGHMLKSGKRSALFTLWITALGILLTPVDYLFHFIERHYKKHSGAASGEKAGPFIFICGPARSGTTLVYQVLAQHLDVAYIRNFTTLFSRSPLLASSLFTRRRNTHKAITLENYYGKTAGLQGPSEANHLWNQWVDADSSGFRTQLHGGNAQTMADFFQQFSQSHKKPVLSKNNNANAFADVIAENLNNSYFICLRRDTDFLAQSLIRARLEINGDIRQSYGVVDTSVDADTTSDPVDEVLQQISYLNLLAEKQQQKLGHERFWIIDYEDFCANPGTLIDRVEAEILHRPAPPTRQRNVDRIAHNNLEKDAALLQRIRQAQKDSA